MKNANILFITFLTMLILFTDRVKCAENEDLNEPENSFESELHFIENRQLESEIVKDEKAEELIEKITDLNNPETITDQVSTKNAAAVESFETKEIIPKPEIKTRRIPSR